MDKIKDVLHINKNKDTTTSTTHTTGTHTTGTNHTGNGVPEGSVGPHSSKVANAADPRVDSDLDSSRHNGAGIGGTHGTSGVGHNTSTGAGYGSSNNTGIGSSNTTAGPHSSNLANKVDPRVDSDLSSANHIGASGGAFDGNHAAPHGTTSGYTSGSHAGNNLTGNTGTHGGISHSTNAGPHNSNMANSMDPRVDSDLSGSGNRHGASTGGILGASGSHATAGSGTAQNTAGPHNSDMLNKVDPRVDSDRDNSKTYGGNATHQ